MKKVDGKEYYTFVGLLNRIESCRNRQYNFGVKDIPQVVEFFGVKYDLTPDKKSYFNQATGSLEEAVARKYDDLRDYLTEFDFIVDPAYDENKAEVTMSERKLIDYLALFSKDYATHVSVYDLDSNTQKKKLCLWRKSANGQYLSINCIEISKYWFGQFIPGKYYRISNLEISDE